MFVDVTNQVQKKAAPAKSSNTLDYNPVVNEEELDFHNKLHCVDELASRWWYALPPWPPADYDYTAVLAKNGLRAIEVDGFRQAPEFDAKTGCKKVYQIECFTGVYRDL